MAINMFKAHFIISKKTQPSLYFMDGDFQKVKAQKLRDLQKLLILYLGRFLWSGGGDCSSGLKPVRGGEPWGALPLPF